MNDLLYLTLECENEIIKQIVLANKKEEAAESMVADNKWRKPICMYVHKVNISITGILIKGDHVGNYRIQQ